MARKTFAQETTVDAFASLEQDYQKAQAAQIGEDTNEGSHRCSIKLPAHLYKYLKAAMYRESSPEQLCSMAISSPSSEFSGAAVPPRRWATTATGSLG